MAQVENVIDWIVDGHVDEFRSDFSVVERQFPDLTDSDKTVLKIIQDKGLVEWDSANADVVGQTGQTTSARSYGW